MLHAPRARSDGRLGTKPARLGAPVVPRTMRPRMGNSNALSCPRSAPGKALDTHRCRPWHRLQPVEGDRGSAVRHSWRRSRVFRCCGPPNLGPAKRRRRKPWARMPQARKASNSSFTNCGRSARAAASACAKKVAAVAAPGGTAWSARGGGARGERRHSPGPARVAQRFARIAHVGPAGRGAQ